MLNTGTATKHGVHADTWLNKGSTAAKYGVHGGEIRDRDRDRI